MPNKKPSLALVMSNAKSNTAQPYAEETTDNLDRAASSPSPAKMALKNFKNMSPKERATNGAKFGAGVGMSVAGGVHGALMGAAIGAVAGRGLGLAQSGEKDELDRLGKIAETLKTMHVVNEKGAIEFSDGSQVPLNVNPNTRLKNLNSQIVTGKKDRASTEIDFSNPLSKRSMVVARPLARFLAGILRYNTKNPQDLKAIDNTTAILVNALQTDAKNINKVYERAQEVSILFGVKEEDMRRYFESIKGQLSEGEAGDIKKGLDILYA